MKFTPLRLQDVVLIDPVVHDDGRGFLFESWRADLFATAGINVNFVMDLHSQSSYGTIRGLHYQVPQMQGKLVRVLSGEIFDVAVDIRRSSPGMGQWTAEVLSADNKRALWIPPGFAHGFQVLSDSAEVAYKMTEYYAPEHEKTILWNDPELGIDWPLDEEKISVSDKDGAGVLFKDAITCA